MKNKKILVVDDTPASLDIVADILNQYDIIEVTNGKEALGVLKHEKVDLILLDIMMPDMDGYEVCERLKSNPDTKDIPIIFITAKTDDKSIDTALDIGGIDYITKPFEPKELLMRIKIQLKMNLAKQKSDGIFIILNNGYRWNKKTNSLMKENAKIKLSRYETLFIQCLVNNINQTLSYEQIHLFVYDYSDYSLSALTSLAKRIRKKTTKDFIQSSFKLGYKIESSK